MSDNPRYAPYPGLASAAQQTLSVCNNNWADPPKEGIHRIYHGAVHYSWKAWGMRKRNDKIIKYEIRCRTDDSSRKNMERRKATVKAACATLTKGEYFNRVAADCPADYVEKLLKVEPKHTSRPCWDTFDFSGVVCHLAAWLAGCSWKPDMYLHDFVDTKSIRLVPVSNLEDSAALAANAVFISQLVACRPGSGAYWALVAAAGACGVTVATDRALVISGDAPRFFSRSGVQLWQDLCDALRILAELYDRASAGEVFAFAMTKGFHAVSSVVAHSDEGGFNRDVWRECQFPPPYGGLPPACPMHAGLPTLAAGAPYSSLVTIVDSFCLRSAAAVAHCAPMVAITAGGVRPAAIMGSLRGPALEPLPTKPPPGSPQDDVDRYDALVAEISSIQRDHVLSMRGTIEDYYAELGYEYIPALAKLCGLAPSTDRVHCCRYWLQMAASSVLDTYDNRHLLKSNLFCPFYWVEPTSLLPRSCFGTVAEREGWASLGCGNEQLREPWMANVREADSERFGWQSYELDFEGARKSLWIHALQDHRDGGLAFMHFKRCDPELFMCCGGQANSKGHMVAFEDRESIANYLWTRGQSPIPHPSEFTHFDRRVVIAVDHRGGNGNEWLSSVPCKGEIGACVVDVMFTNASGATFGDANRDNRASRTYRSRGLAAFVSACSRIRNELGETIRDGGYTVGVVGTPDRDRPRPADVFKAHTKVGSGAESQEQGVKYGGGEHVGACSAPRSKPQQATTAAKMEPVMHAGSHAGPRLPTGPVLVPVGGGDGQGAQAGDGGAGAIGNVDGRGAAGAAPGN